MYGNYKNPTRMRRWRRLDDGSKPGHSEVTLQKGVPERGDVETKQTLKFDAEKKTVEVANRALGQR